MNQTWTQSMKCLEAVGLMECLCSTLRGFTIYQTFNGEKAAPRSHGLFTKKKEAFFSSSVKKNKKKTYTVKPKMLLNGYE